MDTVSKEYQDLLDGVHYQKPGSLRKSQVKAHTRRTKSGKTVLVREHEDKRQPKSKGPIGTTWESIEGKKTVIGETQVGGESRLVIRVGGSKQRALIKPAELERERQLDEKRLASRADMQDRTNRISEKESAEKAAREETFGFTEGMTSVRKEKVLQALQKQQGFSGKVISRKTFVESAVRAGAKVEDKDGKRLVLASGSFYTEGDITKTAMDYAAHLIDTRFGKLEKSLIHAFKRVLRSGKTIFVKEHTDSRRPKSRSDEDSLATFRILGHAASEAKLTKPPKEALAELPLESLHRLRYKLGGLSHRVLMNHHLGRPLHYWLASIDGEIRRRSQA